MRSERLKIGPTQAPVGAFFYKLRVSRSVVVSLNLSRRNAASESERTAACELRLIYILMVEVRAMCCFYVISKGCFFFLFGKAFSIQAMLRPMLRMVCIPSKSLRTSSGVMPWTIFQYVEVTMGMLAMPKYF